MLQATLLRRTVWFVIFMMFFAQAATAAEACLRVNMATAVAADDSSHCAVEKKASLNLCLYQYADKSDQTATDFALPACDTPVLVLADTAFAPLAPRFVADFSRSIHDPPIPIRFCSLLI
jgi:hypothetical protein